MRLKWPLLFCAVALAGCDGDGDGLIPEQDTQAELSGAGVKGPMANAAVEVFQLDPSAADLRGTSIATGSTSAAARIEGLSLPDDLTGSLLIVYSVDTDTIDLTTGEAPVIAPLVNVRPASAVLGGAPFYATPLTTMAVQLARANADRDTLGYAGNGDGTISAAEFDSALETAAASVKSSFGFGVADDVDLFAQAPLLEAGDDAAAQQLVLAYRTAVEALTAVVARVRDRVVEAGGDAGTDINGVFEALTDDLADGAIDGQADGTAIERLSGIDVAADVAVAPTGLTVPGTGLTVADVATMLADEADDAGTGVDTTELRETITETLPANPLPDSDGDGTPDRDDDDPTVPDEGATAPGDGTSDTPAVWDQTDWDEADWQ